MSFSDAVEMLAGMAGLPMPQITEEIIRNEKKKATLYDVMDAARNWFVQNLKASMGREALAYLQRRGLGEAAISKFQIGYAPDIRTGLKKHFESLGIEERLAIDAGLLIKTDGGDSYDRFRGRVIFPIIDVKNRVIAFGGRIIGEGQPKYLNSPETEIFKKGHVLYNENNARRLAFKTGRLVVAEGYMDVIAMDNAGIKSAVAPLGTAITDTHIKRLWSLASEPVVCLDGDSAGKKAMVRAAHLCLPVLEPGFTLKFALLPEKLDPDDFVKKYGVEPLRQILRNAMPLSEALWQSELAKNNAKTPEDKADLEKRLEDLLKMVKNSTLAKHYRDYFKQQLWELNANKNFKGKKSQKTTLNFLPSSPAINLNTPEGCEHALVIIILSHPELLSNSEVYEEFSGIELRSDRLEEIHAAILEIGHNEDISDKKLLEALEKAGLSSNIRYLEGVKGELLLENFTKGDSNSALLSWKYLISLYNLLVLKLEYQIVEQEVSEDSEQMAAELRRQVTDLQKEIMRMELAFGDDK